MSGPRQPGVDGLKALAAQAIVLHHLCTYGPVADALAQALPDLVGWFYGYGRRAVQVFLVLGGYLAAGPLLRGMGGPASALWRALGLRYLRLVPPFVVATALAVLVTQGVGPWLSGELRDPKPQAGQLLAHLFLLHEVLDVGALSAGVWYVAMDFQLYALMAVLLWLGQRGGEPRWAIGLVWCATGASLLVWNLNSDLADWALYFFGAYGLGALARWGQAAASTRAGWVWRMGLVLLGALALLVDFRIRIALALTVAVLLLLNKPNAQHRQPNTANQLLAWLGQRSYALFLVHFPVLLLGNAVWARSGASGPVWGCAFWLTIWSASWLLAWAFERWVEAPLGRRWAQPTQAFAKA